MVDKYSFVDNFYNTEFRHDVIETFNAEMKVRSNFNNLFTDLQSHELITFGDHHDDNFRAGDINFILNKFSTKEALSSTESISTIGMGGRGWFTSTFNRFVFLFLSEIRSAICRDEKKVKISKESNVTFTGAITALASWVCHKFGISGPTAIGISTAVLLTIAYATQGAFCKMTDEEVKKAFDEKVKRAP
ncbi:hypothetical protein [Kiloniella majae]|uniref:hypothetical protein n=1 Tax=Kiloniella majae TaxID=1938558 RepID=UPI000A278C85|nr:hypothetical protein [Kiloniella majae]